MTHPIKLCRVMFAAVTTPSKTRSEVLWSASSSAGTFSNLDVVEQGSSGMVTPATIDEPMSPVFPHISETLTQPPERYYLELFFTDSDEPTTNTKVISAMDAKNWQVAMEPEVTSIRENDTWDLVEHSENR